MKHNHIFTFLLAVIASTLFSSCVTELKFDSFEVTPGASSSVSNETYGIQLTVPSEASSNSISLKASSDWTAEFNNSNASSWCTLTPASGSKGEAKIVVATSTNESYDERNATITFRCGDDVKSIVVTQKQKGAILVSSGKVEVLPEGGTVEIDVDHSVDYECDVDPACASWVHIVETKALEHGKIVLDIDRNIDQSPREGSVTIRSSAGTETARIYQQGSGPCIILTQRDYVVSDRGEEIRIEIKSNVDYTYYVTEGADWLTELVTRSVSTNTITFIAEANETSDERIGKIVFSNKADGLEETVTVTQVQKDAIVAAKKEYSVNKNSQELSFKVMTNVDITVSTNCDWISEINTKALHEQELLFQIDYNSTGENRTGTITVKGGNATQTITVVQLGLDNGFVYRYFLEKALGGNLDKVTEIIFHTEDDHVTDICFNDWSRYPVYLQLDGTVLHLYTESKLFDIDPYKLFYGFSSLEKIDLSKVVLAEESPSMFSMFSGCSSLKEIQFGDFDTSEISKMNEMFAFCSSIRALDLSIFDTSNVTDMGMMFYGCTSLESLNISSFNTSNVTGDANASFTGMEMMFDGCSSLKTLDLSNFDTSNVLSMGQMFNDCASLESLNISSFDVSQCLDMHSMFSDCISLKQLVFGSGFNTGKCENMTTMFYNCSSLESLDLSSFDTRNVKYMIMMFEGCSSLTSLDLSSFITSDVYSMLNMFNGCSALKRLDISSFDLSKTNSVDGVLCGVGDNGDVCTIICTKTTKDRLLSDASNAISNVEWVIVEGGDLYESSDYSEDGKVYVLQKATVGNGIDFVILGDGYSDRLIADGVYHEVAKKVMESLFLLEPLKSYREMFNVYEVVAVSKNETFTGSTALLTTIKLVDRGIHAFSDWGKIAEYASKSVDEKRMDNVTVAVVLNTTGFRATAGWTYPEDHLGDWGEGMGVGYVGISDDEISHLTLHEVVGHAFGKLQDEYGLFGTEQMEEGGDSFIKEMGIFKNVDYTDDPDKIKWSRFLKDPRYEGTVGIYEGGAEGDKTKTWHSSYSSVMNGSDAAGFNAVSREALYYRIHKLAYGPDWEYDYETFVQQDLKNLKTAANSAKRTNYVEKDRSFDPWPSPKILPDWRSVLRR